MAKFSLYIICIVGLLSCSKIPPNVEKALLVAGNNKSQLDSVIEYFKQKNDRQQLEAAYFLIANMPGKKYIEYRPVDSLGNIVNYTLFDYHSYDSIIAMKKKFQDSLGRSFKYIKYAELEDIKTITANFLIENIEYAFKAWKMPWAKHLSFKEFCEYLLPYRFGNEPLESWRKNLFEHMQWVLDSLKNDYSTLHICQIINDSIKKSFAYRHYELDFYPGILSYSETQKIKGGRCDDLNMIGAYWMRSIGVPVASEFTPVWANSNFGGHSWLSVLIENKKNIPFNPAYDNPILDSLPFKENRLCKIYRRVFAIDSSQFLEKHRDTKYYPDYLLADNFFDVTKEIIKTGNYTIPTLINKQPGNLLLLGVLCEENWQAVDTTKANNIITKTINVRDIGYNAIYIVYEKTDSAIKYYSQPFLIDNNGKFSFLNPSSLEKDHCTINFKKDYWWLRKNRAYTLSIWNNDGWNFIETPLKWNGKMWAPLKKSTFVINENDSMITFNEIPKNSLLRLQNIDSTRDIGSFGRPFIIIKGNAKYY